MQKQTSTKISFMRHGESIANAEGFLAGQLDIPLTAAGRDAAKRVADDLARQGARFDTIITSTLSRAHETAQIIHAKTTDKNTPPKIIILLDLIEQNGGAFQGGPIDLYHAASSEAIQKAGGESIADLIQRAERVGHEISRIAKGNTLVVGHSELYRAMLLAAHGLPPEDFGTVPRPANTTLLTFPFTPADSYQPIDVHHSPMQPTL